MGRSRAADAVEILCALSFTLMMFLIGVVYFIPRRLFRSRHICNVCGDTGMHGADVCPHQLQMWS